MFELLERGLKVERQVAVPIVYRGHTLDCGYRIDLLVDNEVIVELKCVEKIDPVHVAQLVSHLRLFKHTVGLLINFRVKLLALEGVRRIVNGFQD